MILTQGGQLFRIVGARPTLQPNIWTIFFNPLLIEHPAYVQMYFFSMDVENLYTNISIVAGIDCVSKIFKKCPDLKRPDEELLRLLEINLTSNDFVFNRTFGLNMERNGVFFTPNPNP